jgi:hypothetical protein
MIIQCAEATNWRILIRRGREYDQRVWDLTFACGLIESCAISKSWRTRSSFIRFLPRQSGRSTALIIVPAILRF